MYDDDDVDAVDGGLGGCNFFSNEIRFEGNSLNGSLTFDFFASNFFFFVYTKIYRAQISSGKWKIKEKL